MSHRHGAKVDALLAREQSLQLRAYDPMEVRAFGPLPAAKTGLGLWPKTRRAGNDEPWTASVPKAQLGTGSTSLSAAGQACLLSRGWRCRRHGPRPI